MDLILSGKGDSATMASSNSAYGAGTARSGLTSPVGPASRPPTDAEIAAGGGDPAPSSTLPDSCFRTFRALPHPATYLRPRFGRPCYSFSLPDLGHWDFTDDSPSFPMCHPILFSHTEEPSPHANGKWRFLDKDYPFGVEKEDATFVDGGFAYRCRYRKWAVTRPDGSKIMYGFRETPGWTKDMVTRFARSESTAAVFIARYKSQLDTIWLDTSVPKTNVTKLYMSLEYKLCHRYWVNTRQFLLFAKVTKVVNGQVVEETYHPFPIKLSQFSTKAAAHPLVQCEAAEKIREFRGELKREIPEKVFHPRRVERMMEIYGDDWAEHV